MTGFIMVIRQPLVEAVAITFPVVGSILVGLRVYARRSSGTEFGVDGWLSLAALASMFVSFISMEIGAVNLNYGYYAHDWEAMGLLDDTYSPWYLHWYWITELCDWLFYVFVFVTLGLTKLSLLAFYRRIFGSVRWFRIMSNSVMVFVVMWTVAFALQVVFWCPKPSDYWDTKFANDWDGFAAACAPSQMTMWPVNAWTDVGIDLVVLMMPIPLILKLHMSGRKKAAVCGIFALGWLVVIASLLRAILSTLSYLFVDGDDDHSMYMTNDVYWIAFETGMSFIGVNILALAPLAKDRHVRGLAYRVAGYMSVSLRSRDSKERSISPSPLRQKLNDMEMGRKEPKVSVEECD